MKKKRIISIILTGIVVVVFTTITMLIPALAAPAEMDNVPYSFPVTPDDSEWAELTTK